jgi:hypothetical protein
VSAYLGWDDLEDEAAAAFAPAAGPSDSLDQVDPEGRAKLTALFAERQALEDKLMRLLGKAPPTPDDKRKDAMFPMPIHTAESRLVDKKAASEEQRARALARRAIERARISAQDERAREEEKRQAERKLLQAEALLGVEQARRQERHDAWLRALRVREGMRSRWAGQRELALRRQQVERVQTRVLFEVNNEKRRQTALGHLQTRRREEELFQARLDARSRQKRDATDWRDES